MKHFKNLMLCSVAFLAMTVTACGGGNGGNGGSSEPQKDENEVSVFLLSGQSNMEGNSKIANLKDAFTDLGFNDYDEVSKGFSSVQISTYLGGYGGLNKDNLTNNTIRDESCIHGHTGVRRHHPRPNHPRGARGCGSGHHARQTRGPRATHAHLRCEKICAGAQSVSDATREDEG